MSSNILFPSEMIFDKELTIEQLNLLESQYKKFLTISKEKMDINQYQLYLDKNKKPYFPKGTLIHGTTSSLKTLKKISETGIQIGDVITKINGKKVRSYEELSVELAVSNSKEIELTVLSNGIEKTYNIEPTKVDENYLYGFTLNNDIEKDFFKSIKYSFEKTGNLIKQMVLIVKYLFTGKLELNNLSGPVGIYQVVDQARTLGFLNIIYLIAYLCINVGFINFIPFPAFDGGRILFLIIEKIKGSKVNPKIENIIHSIGFVLLMILMVFVTYNDIIRIFK